jgi:signal transduction histidine kinase
MIKSSLLTFLDWFVPAALRGDTAMLWRARVFAVTHLFGPLLGASIIVYLFRVDPHPGIHLWIVVACNSLFVVLPFILRVTGKLTALATVSVATLTFVSFYGSYFYGGVSSPFQPWVLTALLLGFFYLRERLHVVFAIFLVCLTAFWVAYFITGAFPERIPARDLAGVGILSVCCATIYTATMAIYYAAVVSAQSHLEREVQRHLKVAVELAKRKEDAERANRAKSVFLAKMSHQLRTPLNAVIGYSEILLEDAAQEANAEQQKDLKRINNAGKHLLSLVADVLDVSKIDAQDVDLTIQPFELCGFIEDVAETCRSLIANNGNEFKIECEDGIGSVISDPTRLRQAILNLLSNAGKFTRRGKVALSARRVRRGHQDWIEISVRDTGIGIKPENLQRLFTEFNQAEASTERQFGGTGLGLAVSQSLCRAMNGRIRVESEYGQGSCFTIEIPAQLERTPRLAEAPIAVAGASSQPAEQVAAHLDRLAS